MSTSAESRGATTVASEKETRALARSLGESLTGGEVIALDGPLGAGKTTFTKGLAEGLGIDPRDVTSPTFLLLHELSGRLDLCHLDAYRVADGEALLEIGGSDVFREDSVVVIEWAERVPEILPADRLEILIDYAGDEARQLEVQATGPRHRACLAWLQGEAGG